MTSSWVLECADLEMRVGYRPLLTGVKLSLAAGQRLALVGPNGSGKTTLMRVLAGVSKPHMGFVRVFGESLWEERRCTFEHLSCYLASQPALLLEHPVNGNLEFMCNAYGHNPTWKALESALDRVGLAGRGNQTARTLSTGQKRRLTLAALLLLRPRLLLADEPTNGLDTGGALLCQNVFAELAQQYGTAYLVASHDPQMIAWCGQSLDVTSFLPQRRGPGVSAGAFIRSLD